LLTRRSFVQTAGIGAAAFIGARGRENSLWSFVEPTLEALAPGVICLASNENPTGPGKTVLDAVTDAFGPTGARPGRYDGGASALIEAIAKKQGVKPENVVLGCGSTQILRTCTHLFTAKDRPLVATIPTYEECAGYAEMIGHPVRAVMLDANFKVDVDHLAAAAKGAGLVYHCNPNNPTATYVGARATREFLARVAKDSPYTYVLIDEAYFDYVTDPDHATHIPAAVENPHVIVARTFSKAYGMAGLRMGYAIGHPDTIRKMADWDAGVGTTSLNVLAMHAGIAAIQQDPAYIAAERRRNTEVRDFTMKWFADRGMTPSDSQANFMFVNLGRPAKEFREACKAKGVLVARDFPPFEKTHCRLSFGTMDEMKKAVAVFDEVLKKKASAA
jgi:histidinol-phosphate aminotransferase